MTPNARLTLPNTIQKTLIAYLLADFDSAAKIMFFYEWIEKKHTTYKIIITFVPQTNGIYMIRFECDYAEGAHPKILERLVQTNFEQTKGYGDDRHYE